MKQSQPQKYVIIGNTLTLLPPANVVCEGYVLHVSVSHSVHGGGCLVPGVPAGRECLVLGWGVWSWGVPGPGGSGPRGVGAWWRTPLVATAAGGTHPTGMHSCCLNNFT